MKNVDLIARTLEEAGVQWVFGVPSGPVLPLINALEKTSVSYVLTASETSAGFMATAVGSLTGTPGVCLSTLGPGVNLDIDDHQVLDVELMRRGLRKRGVFGLLGSL